MLHNKRPAHLPTSINNQVTAYSLVYTVTSPTVTMDTFGHVYDVMSHISMIHGSESDCQFGGKRI